ncbi:MAG: 30S ribosomal protein S15 [Planctomycetaceae bacterium]|jgi:small subunit ribosomal protein S15|nr:30S ribosomal protein S15 [Planctomycetaceae bacterium]
MTSFTKEDKQGLIRQFERSAGDTGSSEVQIAILTKRINLLTEHLKTSKRDYASQRGLMQMVSRRRRLLDYLKDRVPQRYVDIIQKLGIRR